VDVMPFGKYRDVPLSDVPGSYLAWCLENLTELRPPYRDAIALEIDRRRRITALSYFLESTHNTPHERRRAALMELACLRDMHALSR
jgi:hypothetical protein